MLVIDINDHYGWERAPLDPNPDGEHFYVSTFAIGTNPQIRLSEIKARKFYIVDYMQMRFGARFTPFVDLLRCALSKIGMMFIKESDKFEYRLLWSPWSFKLKWRDCKRRAKEMVKNLNYRRIVTKQVLALDQFFKKKCGW